MLYTCLTKNRLSTLNVEVLRLPPQTIFNYFFHCSTAWLITGGEKLPSSKTVILIIPVLTNLNNAAVKFLYNQLQKPSFLHGSCSYVVIALSHATCQPYILALILHSELLWFASWAVKIRIHDLLCFLQNHQMKP